MTPDGVVYVGIEYIENAIEYINVDEILRFKDLNEKSCSKRGIKYPCLLIEFKNQTEITIMGGNAREFKKEIEKEIKNHYHNLAEGILTGGTSNN